MKPRRRLTFQLTPLLDLLLIVIFAQFMEVQHSAESGEVELETRRAQLEEEYATRLESLDQQFTTQKNQIATRGEQYNEYFSSILKQHKQAATVLAESLNLPGQLVEQIAKFREVGDTTSAEQLADAGQQLKDLLPQRSEELFRFFLRYDEMQKHVSIWELHLQENGKARFSDGQSTALVDFTSPEDFEERAFRASKGFSEPKPLVILLLTYGDTQAGFRRKAESSLPNLVQRLRNDAGNTRWFDYSLLGFRPDGPLLNRSQ